MSGQIFQCFAYFEESHFGIWHYGSFHGLPRSAAVIADHLKEKLSPVFYTGVDQVHVLPSKSAAYFPSGLFTGVLRSWMPLAPRCLWARWSQVIYIYQAASSSLNWFRMYRFLLPGKSEAKPIFQSNGITYRIKPFIIHIYQKFYICRKKLNVHRWEMRGNGLRKMI